MESDTEILARIYERQFGEFSQLRRYICSMVQFRRFMSLVEPGCGTGLLAREITALTDASYTGIDIDENILAIARRNSPESEGLKYVHSDAYVSLSAADAYLSSFFLAGLSNPLAYLRRAADALKPEGLYIVFGEYNYGGTLEEPPCGLAASLIESLQLDGFSVDLGGNLDSIFTQAGFRTMSSGSMRSDFQEPDRDFISLQLGVDDIDVHSLVSWEISWGIYRTLHK